MDSGIGTPCSIRFGQNAKTWLDGLDKMPTKKLGRTKCQPQKKVRTKCQPLVGIMSGWHFVRLAFCPVGILSYNRHIGVLHFYSTMIQVYILVTWDQSGSTLWYDDIRICWHLQHSYKLLFAAVGTTGPGKCWNFKRNIVTDRLILNFLCKLR